MFKGRSKKQDGGYLLVLKEVLRHNLVEELVLAVLQNKFFFINISLKNFYKIITLIGTGNLKKMSNNLIPNFP